MGDQPLTRRQLRAQQRRNAGVRGLLRRHLRTPDPTEPAPAGRHTTPRRSATVALLTCLGVGLLAPLLLLTTLVPGSPAALKKDPAVAALLAYEAGLDRSPASRVAADEAATTLTITTLANGDTKAARIGGDGQCYYLLVPADPAQDTSGVRAGVPDDCAPRGS